MNAISLESRSVHGTERPDSRAAGPAARVRLGMERPEEHRNLLIRVAGSSDYCTLLSREIQDEILSRSEPGV